MSVISTPLLSGHYYHIYNRGVNKQTIFAGEEWYIKFLQLINKYFPPVIDLYSFCLLPNHFHLLISISEQYSEKPHLPISHVCNSYTQSFNKCFDRTGVLFERPFKRKLIDNLEYLWQVICYIHLNPDHHCIDSYLTYPWSSFHAICSDCDTIVRRDDVLRFFGGKEDFLAALQEGVKIQKIRDYILE